MQEATPSQTETGLAAPASTEEEVEDEETVELENGTPEVSNTTGTGRLVTLQNLLGAGVLHPGDGAMTIEYLGQRFVGDLLSDGKIRSQETGRVFASPSAWAVSCKRIINPDKKSGCGWASVRYRGKKLDVYKSAWLKRKSEESQNKENDVGGTDCEMDSKPDPINSPSSSSTTTPAATINVTPHLPRLVVKHGVLGNRQSTHDSNVLVDCSTFSSLGKIQPFLITFSTNAALLMDFHCHLTSSEVTGYLGGVWDVASHNLLVTQVYPCRCRLGDHISAPEVEGVIRKRISSRGLSLVGWYHSHPSAPAVPSLRDIDTQLEYELTMKGSEDIGYLPCIGVIDSPYNVSNTSLESSIVSYWVVPPPDNRPHEYGKPMMMVYSISQDMGASQELLLEMKKCVDFYKPENDFINFKQKYSGQVTYLDKLKTSLVPKFPRELQNSDTLWNFITDLISIENVKSEEELQKQIEAIATSETEEPPAIAHTARSMRARSMWPKRTREDLITPSLEYFLGADFATALFGGKCHPSLFGLDAATKSLLSLNTLSLGGMFLPPLPDYKDPSVGLMKPPPPPSYYSPTSRNSRAGRSRSSSGRSRTSSSIPHKIPKLDMSLSHFLLPASLGGYGRHSSTNSVSSTSTSHHNHNSSSMSNSIGHSSSSSINHSSSLSITPSNPARVNSTGTRMALSNSRSTSTSSSTSSSSNISNSLNITRTSNSPGNSTTISLVASTSKSTNDDTTAKDNKSTNESTEIIDHPCNTNSDSSSGADNKDNATMDVSNSNSSSTSENTDGSDKTVASSSTDLIDGSDTSNNAGSSISSSTTDSTTPSNNNAISSDSTTDSLTDSTSTIENTVASDSSTLNNVSNGSSDGSNKE